MAVLPPASCAVTVTVIGDPAVAEAGAETTSVVAPPAATLTLALPVIDDVAVSVAVTVVVPAVFKVAANVPTPFVSAASAPRIAAVSVLVRCTVPV